MSLRHFLWCVSLLEEVDREEVLDMPLGVSGLPILLEASVVVAMVVMLALVYLPRHPLLALELEEGTKEREEEARVRMSQLHMSVQLHA